MDPTRGDTVRRLGLILLGLGLATVLAELALRAAAALSPEVHLLATGLGTRPTRSYRRLEDYMTAYPAYLAPHRPWLGYWTNALGFNDAEFVEPKPGGRLRFLVVGDSFTFGLVPYPDALMTRAEEGLRTACPARDLDLLNLGVIGAGVREYRTVLELYKRRDTHWTVAGNRDAARALAAGLGAVVCGGG